VLCSRRLQYLPILVDKAEKICEENGLRHDSIVMRMTGCPNGCARPYFAEIAFVGKAPGVYLMLLGGGYQGHGYSGFSASSQRGAGSPGACFPALLQRAGLCAPAACVTPHPLTLRQICAATTAEDGTDDSALEPLTHVLLDANTARTLSSFPLKRGAAYGPLLGALLDIAMRRACEPAYTLALRAPILAAASDDRLGHEREGARGDCTCCDCAARTRTCRRWCWARGWTSGAAAR
jgi:hypothetical protein